MNDGKVKNYFEDDFHANEISEAYGMKKSMNLGNRIFRLFGLTFMMLFVVGVSAGFPGIVRVLLNASLYEDSCLDLNLTHKSNNCTLLIEKQLSIVGTTTFSIIPAIGFIMGLLNDLWGHENAGFLGAFLWTFFTCFSGFLPQKGVFFFIGFLMSNIGSVSLFLAMMANYHIGLSPKRFPMLTHAILTGGMMTLLLLLITLFPFSLFLLLLLTLLFLLIFFYIFFSFYFFNH